METKSGFDGLLDHQDDGIDYGKGHSLPSHRTARRGRSTVPHLAAVMDIEKPPRYSRSLVRGCVKIFVACAIPRRTLLCYSKLGNM